MEALDLSAALASHPAVEQALRARAARHADVDCGAVAPVLRVERHGDGVRVVGEVPAGLRLSDLLADLELGHETLSDAAAMEIASAVIAAVAAIHQLPGALAHGAVNPSHAVLTREGTIVLTDGIFGGALEALQLNREQLWREFGLALPAAANLPRFDQRADVTQLGAVVLALVLRRPMRFDEYPRGIADLVMEATKEGTSPCASALRMWLQQALQLHPRALFGSAGSAQRAFAEIVSAAGPRRAASQAVRTLVRKHALTPQPPDPVPAFASVPRPAAPIARPDPPQPAPRNSGTFLRSMFSSIRAN